MKNIKDYAINAIKIPAVISLACLPYTLLPQQVFAQEYQKSTLETRLEAPYHEKEIISIDYYIPMEPNGHNGGIFYTPKNPPSTDKGVERYTNPKGTTFTIGYRNGLDTAFIEGWVEKLWSGQYKQYERGDGIEYIRNNTNPQSKISIYSKKVPSEIKFENVYLGNALDFIKYLIESRFELSEKAKNTFEKLEEVRF